jgi:hypothetical protein
MGHVFVSYSRWDRRGSPVIDRLLLDLRRESVSLWLAPDDVPAGQDWQGAIPQALTTAEAMIYIASKRLAKARGMARELERAVKRSIPIFPVLLDQQGLELLPPELADAPRFELFADYDKALKDLLVALPETTKSFGVGVDPVAPRAQSKGYVFISYAEEDTPFVSKLRAFLKERGYGYWDYAESERNYHTHFFNELEEVIMNATATVSVLSPDWKKSKWTAKEYMFSEDVNVPVFLLMAQPMGPTLVTAGIPYIDFTRDETQGFERLDRELRRKGLI